MVNVLTCRAALDRKAFKYASKFEEAMTKGIRVEIVSTECQIENKEFYSATAQLVCSMLDDIEHSTIGYTYLKLKFNSKPSKLTTRIWFSDLTIWFAIVKIKIE